MATKDATRVRKPEETGVEQASHDLPDKKTARELLAKMMLIRRFEERAGEMYAKAKIGGVLPLGKVGGFPPPAHRRGGRHSGRHPGHARHGLPDVHLPRARSGDRPGHAARRG